MRQKKCKVCGEKFQPFRPLQVCCTSGCAIEHAQKQRAKKEARELRDAKEKIKTRADWIKEVQQVVNKYIRVRDRNDGCISCDKPASWSGQWHASHFYATSIRPNLRFDESNIHKACSQCNKWMHGNLVPYREKLIQKIGIEEVLRLDADRAPKHYTVSELKEIKAIFKTKTKELGDEVHD